MRHSDIDIQALQQSLRDAVTVVAPRGTAHHAESEEQADELRPAAHRVCRHMLDGGCFRSDCPFSHDVSGIPCRYFGTQIGCRNGPSCPFLHHESSIRTPSGPAQAAAPKTQNANQNGAADNISPGFAPGFPAWPMQAPEQMGAHWDFVSGMTPPPTQPSESGLLPSLPSQAVDWSTPLPAASTAASPAPALTAAMQSAAKTASPWEGPPSTSLGSASLAQQQWGQPSSSQHAAQAAGWGAPSFPAPSASLSETTPRSKPEHTPGTVENEDDGHDMVLGEEDSLPFEGDDLDWLLQMAADATDAAQAARRSDAAAEQASAAPPSALAPPQHTSEHAAHTTTAHQRPARSARIFLGPIPPWVVQDLEDLEVQGGVKNTPPSPADFPVLGGSRSPAPPSDAAQSKAASAWGGDAGRGAPDGSRLSLSDRLKLQWLVDAVAQGMKDAGINDPRRGDADVVQSVFLESGRDLEVAKRVLQQRLDISIAVQRADKVQAETYATYEKYAGGTTGMTAAARKAAAAAARRLKWVDTGVGVNATYKSARADAERFAVARNRCFGRATEAYLGGKGAAARAWSKEGRTWDAKMRQAHARAAATIFAQRNAAMGGDDGLLSLDVHGLHPDEAVQVTQDAMRNAGSAQWLAVIMGTGHHSSGAGSVLVEELKRWAERSHVSWFEGGAGAGQGGVMMIQLTR